MIGPDLAEELGAARIIAVITIDDHHRAVPLCEALIEGGVRAIELTLRTPEALASIRAIRAAGVRVILGAGTVLNVDQLNAVRDAGARFAVAPGFNPAVVRAADELGFPFGPGVMTPSEIEGAFALGNTVLKFYHAGLAGGLSALKAMAAPYAHLGLRFIPLGGVSQSNLAEWVADPMILAVGGSWIAPRELISAGDWSEIRSRAQAAVSTASSGARAVADGASS